MILGLGTDIVDVHRVEAALARQGARFLARVLAPPERQQCANYSPARLIEFVAGRFAAKEALAKAIGCGICQLTMAAVAIQLEAAGLTVRWGDSPGLRVVAPNDRLHVSISHTADTAFATAIWERLSG